MIKGFEEMIVLWGTLRISWTTVVNISSGQHMGQFINHMHQSLRLIFHQCTARAFLVRFLMMMVANLYQTSGLIEVFDKKTFQNLFEACYSDPLSADRSFLCHLYLIFAIGLVRATPQPDSPEDAIIRRRRSMQFDQAELFFRSAKSLGDPLTGFEDADFWSVQALLLMSVYMLAVSKRNAAYAYHGMSCGLPSGTPCC